MTAFTPDITFKNKTKRHSRLKDKKDKSDLQGVMQGKSREKDNSADSSNFEMLRCKDLVPSLSQQQFRSLF